MVIIMMKNINLTTSVLDNKLYLKINTDTPIERQPCNIIAILDVSGSMNSPASKNINEGDNLSRLDLLKHTSVTLINLLNENDTFGIVTFSTDAKIKLSNLYMTDDNKRIATDIINDLKTEGTTNIYDGLVKGINLLNCVNNSNNNSLVLLTDGVSNVNPPSGILHQFKYYLETLKLKTYNINTFGFSEDIDSKLLRSISDTYNGVYGFIPDASMVGTCFINYAATVLTTYISNIKINVEFENGTNYIANTGPILLEQERELLLDIDSNKIKKIGLIYDNNEMDIPQNTIETIPMKTIIRYDIIKTITELLKNNYDAVTKLNEFYENIKSKLYMFNEKDKIYINNYIKDYKNSEDNNGGQISLVFSKNEYYASWGVHYLLSLLRSYEMQICLNFKDMGLQNYANNLFNKIRDDAEDIFLKIPPPISKIIPLSQGVSRPVNMQSYYNQSAGCYDGNGIVKMYDNSKKKVQDLVKGDEILTRNNGKAYVKCLIRTNITKDKIPMCKINDLYITPYHPIYINNNWMFPKDYVTTEDVIMESVYNVVLTNGDSLYVNNTLVVSLGHNITDDVARHSYLGTNNVINDLSLKMGYANGFVVLNDTDYIRNIVTIEILKII